MLLFCCYVYRKKGEQQQAGQRRSPQLRSFIQRDLGRLARLFKGQQRFDKKLCGEALSSPTQYTTVHLFISGLSV